MLVVWQASVEVAQKGNEDLVTSLNREEQLGVQGMDPDHSEVSKEKAMKTEMVKQLLI